MITRKALQWSLVILVLLIFSPWSTRVHAAVAPDPLIRSDLHEVFTEAPLVSGYPYQQLFEDAALRYGVPLPLVLAVVRGESFFDPAAKSAKGALGLMQIMPETAADYGVSSDLLLDPAVNIDVGVHLLADLYQELQDPYLVLGAYYCGCGGIDSETAQLRADCDEYVRYIHSHLQFILDAAHSDHPAPDSADRQVVVARFDNVLDARLFLDMLSQSLTTVMLDLFRRERSCENHVRYEYQVLAAYDREADKRDLCRRIEEVTGFSLCR